MKRAMTILVCMLAAGLAGAQNPQIIQNTKAKLDGVRNQATAASNQALGTSAPAAPARQNAPATAKASLVPAQSKAVASPAKTTPFAAKSTAVVKPASATTGKLRAAKKTAVLAVQPQAAVAKASPPAKRRPTAAPSGAAEPAKNVDQQNGKWSMTGRRDPFVSPVVSQTSGSGCSTGKKCLEIGLINLRGVVRSENGFIAVVTNSLNKAYFLRENDPVFDGYVVKITGDSIVFQETLQDHLGKTFTREVVKKITTPAV
jgi:Tfp pilus assembly protein PilP